MVLKIVLDKKIEFFGNLEELFHGCGFVLIRSESPASQGPLNIRPSVNDRINVATLSPIFWIIVSEANTKLTNDGAELSKSLSGAFLGDKCLG